MSGRDQPLPFAAGASGALARSALGLTRSGGLPVLLVALAALSAAVLPTVPSYDPWSWIVWGREVVDPHLSFATGGGPSWKPLPVVFTTVYGLFGSAAPTLWVITARASGLLALLAAWRLASRLALRAVGKERSGAHLGAAIAGVIAVLGVALTQDFFYYMFRGTAEPMLIGTALWTVDRLLARAHWKAFLLAVALSLLRPEAWPFLGCYAVWLWVNRSDLRWLVAAGLVSIPLLWFVPPWIGSGQPFESASHARAYNGHLGSQPVLTALRRALDLQIAPVVVLAAIAVMWDRFGRRDPVIGALLGAAIAWTAIVVATVIDGYPGLERFFLPASVLVCALAGAGAARLALAASDRFRPPTRSRANSSVSTAIAGVAATTAVIAVSIPAARGRVDSARAAEPAAEQAANVLRELSGAVNAVGGRAGVFPCRSSFAAVNHGVQTALAWKLRVTLGRVGTSLHKPGVDFIGPHNAVDGVAAAVDPRLSPRRTLARVGVWRVVRVTLPGHPDRCVGR
jgi:hypothetical protein